MVLLAVALQAGTEKSPLFATTTAAVAKDASVTVPTVVDGEPVCFVRVTPADAPDPGTLHTFAVNEASPVFTMSTGANVYDVCALADKAGTKDYQVWSITLGSEKSPSTTFRIEAHRVPW